MTTKDLNENEFHKYYQNYIDKVSIDVELNKGFLEGRDNIVQFFQSIAKEKLEYSYANDKWTIKEVFQHIIDTERIFMYRCFRIARHDETALAGFNQDDYILPSLANNKSRASLLKEYSAVRESSIALLQSLTDQDLKCKGIASETNMSARAVAFITLGHEIWHIDIIKERYL